MKIIGDIGNTEVKICLVNNNFNIQKKINIKSSRINKLKIKQKLKFLYRYKSKIDTIIFSSVVPKIYKDFSSFFNTYYNKKTIEIKKLNLNKLIDIKVNKKQVGSDRLANSIGAIDKKNNYIIIDFGTATTFDVIIKKKYLGGIISPGMVSFRTLVLRASLIPEINLKKYPIIGKNNKRQ